MITYQMVCCSCFFFPFLFFFSFLTWERNTRICSHMHSHTDRQTCYWPQTQHEGGEGAFGGEDAAQLRPNVACWPGGLASAQWFKRPAPGLRLRLLRARRHRAAPAPLPPLTWPTVCLPCFLQPPPKKEERKTNQGRSREWQNVRAEREVWHPPSFCSHCSSLMTLCWNVRPISSFPSDI